MDFKALLPVLRNVLAVVKEVAPMASVAGPQGAAIGKIVSGAADFAGHVLDHATDAQAVIASHDLAEIKTIAAAIQSENDALAARIDAS